MKHGPNDQRRAVAGLDCYPGGPELTKEIAATARGASAPRMTPDGGVRHFPYRREPYGRARISTDLGVLIIDGKVRATEDRGPLMNLWRLYANGPVLSVFIPRAWVQPIRRDESGWIDVYDILDD